MSKGIITTQKVKVCSFTGDPGCLGFPAWIDHPACDCIYEDVDFNFCDCGGNDIYGEMWHEDDCPAVEPLRAADAALPPSAEADSSLVIVPAVEFDTQPRT